MFHSYPLALQAMAATVTKTVVLAVMRQWFSLRLTTHAVRTAKSNELTKEDDEDDKLMFLVRWSINTIRSFPKEMLTESLIIYLYNEQKVATMAWRHLRQALAIGPCACGRSWVIQQA